MNNADAPCAPDSGPSYKPSACELSQPCLPGRPPQCPHLPGFSDILGPLQHRVFPYLGGQIRVHHQWYLDDHSRHWLAHLATVEQQEINFPGTGRRLLDRMLELAEVRLAPELLEQVNALLSPPIPSWATSVAIRL